MMIRSAALRGLTLIGFVALASCAGSPHPASSRGYFGQEPPGMRPALFAPGVVSTPDAVELNGVFSPDFSEFFFTRMELPPGGGAGVFRMHRSVHGADGMWSTPEHVQVWPDDATSLAVDMAYSPDGNSLYFLGNHPHALSPEDPSNDIWVSERTEDGGWSLAAPVPPPVWTEHSESYPALTPEGALQFSSNRPGGAGASDLWRAAPRLGGGFEAPVNMGPPVNTEHSERNSCVAPDGSYIVFDSNRPGGPGRGALWASFRDESSGAWSEPALLGQGVNTEEYENSQMITPDGRYLLFSRWVSEPRDAVFEGVVAGDVYWISTRVIEALRP